jgi:biopolymer transport protein ExbD
MARRRREKASGTQEHSLLPIMNIMLLLVPALLLAMEVARMAAIDVVPPRVGPATTGIAPPPDMPLRVFVAEDGFVVAIGEGPSERIGLARQGTVAGDPTSYDFAALEERARRVKGVYPDGRLQVDAEGSIPLATLVATLDALRGTECRPGRLGPDETPGPECLYLDVTIAPGTRMADPSAG